MKLSSKTVLVVLLIATLAFTSCGGNNEPIGPTFNPYVGGSDSIEITFMPGMPPTQLGAILDNGGSEFSVGVQIVNKGEYDLGPNELQLDLRGILPDQFNIGWPDLNQILADPLQGSKKQLDGSVTNGQMSSLIFEGLKYLPDAPGDLPKQIRVDACYNYATKSTTQVCLANDVQGALIAQQDAICNVNEVKVTKNSGAPVQISNLRQMPQGGNRISVMFDIVHKGMGEVYKFGTPDNCESIITNPEKNKVYVEVFMTDDSTAQVSCTGGLAGPVTPTEASPIAGEILMVDASPRTVTCSIEEVSGPAQNAIYLDQFNIDLSYNYGQSQDLQITIKDFGTANP